MQERSPILDDKSRATFDEYHACYAFLNDLHYQSNKETSKEDAFFVEVESSEIYTMENNSVGVTLYRNRHGGI